MPGEEGWSASESWVRRRHEIQSLIEQAEELEAAAESHDIPAQEAAFHYEHANNLRLRAICLNGGPSLMRKKGAAYDPDPDENNELQSGGKG
jgi:hypothetical protein